MRRTLAVLLLLALPACTPDAPAPRADGAGPSASHPAPSPSGTASTAPSAAATPSTVPSRAAVRAGVLVTVGDVVEVRDPGTGAVVRTLQRTPDGSVDSDVQVSRDGRTAYVLREDGGFASCGDHSMVALPIAGGAARTLVEQEVSVAGFAVSPDGRTLAYERALCDEESNVVSTWELVLRDLSAGTERVVDTPYSSSAALAFAPDSTTLLAGQRLLDTSTRDPLAGAVTISGLEVFAARFRPSDGALVDVRTGRPVGPSRRLTDTAWALAGSPDGKRFVGLDYPDEGEDYVAGELVSIRAGKAVPLGDGVLVLAVAWG